MKLMNQKAVLLMAILLFFGLISGEESRGNEQDVYPRIVSLDGSWEFQNIPEMAPDRIVPSGWSGVEIPKMGSLKEGHFGAYRKTFKNPKGREGERVVLHFQGVAFSCEVYLNGRLAGRHGPTLEPF